MGKVKKTGKNQLKSKKAIKDKKTGKKQSKSKKAVKDKEIMIMPRSRLEPRLTPKPPKKSEIGQFIDIKDNLRVVLTREICENSYQAASYRDSYVEIKNADEQQSKPFNVSPESNEIIEDFECDNAAKKSKSGRTIKTPHYNDSLTGEEIDNYLAVDDVPSPKSEIDPDYGVKNVVANKNKRRLASKSPRRSYSSSAVVENVIYGTATQNNEAVGNENTNTTVKKQHGRTTRKSWYDSSAENTERICKILEETVQALENNQQALENNQRVLENNQRTLENNQHALENNQRNESVNENTTVTKKQKRHVQNSKYWNDSELMNLSIGLQTEGFSDLKKVADYVKTKSEDDIRLYMRKRTIDARLDKMPSTRVGRPANKWTAISPEVTQTWPNVRKWKKVAYEQMLKYSRHKDYSKQVMSALCQKFYEEEKEPSDPQVINVKLIYKYMMDCMASKIPPQLPPKESLLVLDLLRDVRLMPLVYDFEEERKFVSEFKGATNFKPFEVKDEFKKRVRKTCEEDMFGPNAVSVPEEVYMHLSRHKKLTQAFNPLVTPVWMLQKEQEYLVKYSEESNFFC